MKKVTFYEWLQCQTSRPDPIGDLARDVEQDGHLPSLFKEGGHFHVLMGYLRQRGACEGALEAAKEALLEFRSLDRLACMVESLPNGCSLVHFCTGFENEATAWSVMSWTKEILASGRSARAALMAFDQVEKDEEWWESVLPDVDD